MAQNQNQQGGQPAKNPGQDSQQEQQDDARRQPGQDGEDRQRTDRDGDQDRQNR